MKGEITLLIGRAEENAAAPAEARNVSRRIRELMTADALDEKVALKQAAKEFGISKSEAYRELQRTKN